MTSCLVPLLEWCAHQVPVGLMISDTAEQTIMLLLKKYVCGQQVCKSDIWAAFTTCLEAQKCLCIASTVIVTHQTCCKSKAQLIPTRHISRFVSLCTGQCLPKEWICSRHVQWPFPETCRYPLSLWPEQKGSTLQRNIIGMQIDVLNLPNSFADCLWMTCKQQKYTMSKVKWFVLPIFTADLEGLHENLSSLVLVSLWTVMKERYFLGRIQKNDITLSPWKKICPFSSGIRETNLLLR